MDLRRSWAATARLSAGLLNSITNGLTAGTDEKSDRNVDMLIGGQAVIEGVMMRSLTGYAVAVRQPDGGIALRNEKLVSVTKKYPFLRFPVLRGSVVLIHSLILGMRALNFSASASSVDQEGEPAALIDPVSRRTVPADLAIASVHQGRVYHFEDRTNRDAFEAEPEKYVAGAQALIGQEVNSPAKSNKQTHKDHGCCG